MFLPFRGQMPTTPLYTTLFRLPYGAADAPSPDVVIMDVRARARPMEYPVTAWIPMLSNTA